MKKIVKVTWKDACNYQGWQDKESIKCRLPLTITVGFLLKKSKKKIVIAATMGEDQVGAIVVIPREWCIKIKEIG